MHLINTLYEAKQFLEKKGYLVEYSAYDKEFGDGDKNSDIWKKIDKDFKKGMTKVKQYIRSLKLNDVSEDINEPDKFNDTWSYIYRGYNDKDMKYYFKFYETKMKNDTYGYNYYIAVEGFGINKSFIGNENTDVTKTVTDMINAIDKALKIDTKIADTIYDGLVEVLNKWKKLGYKVLINFNNSNMFSGYENVVVVNISKNFGSEISDKYRYNDIAFKFTILYSIKDNKIEWKIIEDTNKDDSKETEGTIRQLLNMFNELCSVKYSKLQKNMISAKESMKKRQKDEEEYYNKNRTNKKSYKRQIDFIDKLVDDDIIKNFWKAVEINRDYVNEIILQPMVDLINDYVYDNFSDEDGNVGQWNNGDAWNYFNNDFVGYIKKDYDGDFESFCVENDITNIDELHDYINDNWDVKLPKEADIYY